MKAVDSWLPTIWHPLEADNFLNHEDVVAEADDLILKQRSENRTKNIKKAENATVVKETKDCMKAERLRESS